MNDRKHELGRLYDLMEDLADEHNADDALLEQRDDTTAGIVLEFDLPEQSTTDSSTQTREQRR